MTIVVSNPWWFARTRCLLASNWNPLYVRISGKTAFWTFHRAFCGFSRLCLPRIQRRVSFVMKPWLVGNFLCSISTFHLLLPPRGYFCHYSSHRVVDPHTPEQQMKLQLLWNWTTAIPPTLCIPEVLGTRKILRMQIYFSQHLCPPGPPTLFGRIFWSCTFL